MSGLVAILGGPREEEAATRMLRLTPQRGDQTATWSGEGGVMGVGRADWELGVDFAGGAMVYHSASLVIATDASLYYRTDLRKALIRAGVPPEGDAPAQLIAAAYRAWGVRTPEVLEGDFAFLLWDREAQRLLAACDYAGTRPLFYALAGSRLILASSPAVVAAHPAVSRELNRIVVAEDLIGASSMVVDETVYRSVRRLPAGHRLCWQPGAAVQVGAFWEPPVFDRGSGLPEAEAAEQLRALMRVAVRERLATTGPTAVWMSGGYDSPSVCALAQVAGRDGRTVVPVSMSYPEGDPGREDELIEAVARHLGVEVHWLFARDVPGYPDPMEWGARRPEPFAHPYQQWNRTLALGARQAGARVVLSGNGGDQFFGLSPVFLADLLASGQWATLMREAQAIGFGLRHVRQLFRWAVQPLLPPLLQRTVRLARGYPLRAHLQTAVPSWLDLDPATSSALWERQWQYHLRRTGEPFSSAETAWYLQSGFGQRIVQTVSAIGLEAGVEVRSPLYDRRVLEFVARRPRSDRFALGETKRLLRHSLRGVLPDAHLARRQSRTGLPHLHLHQARRAALPRWAERLTGEWSLEGLGLVRQRMVRAHLRHYLGNPGVEGRLGAELFTVMTTECWLRAHVPAAGVDAMVA